MPEFKDKATIIDVSKMAVSSRLLYIRLLDIADSNKYKDEFFALCDDNSKVIKAELYPPTRIGTMMFANFLLRKNQPSVKLHL